MVLNGRIALTQLVQIDATHYAAPGCARAWVGFSRELGLTVGNAADAAYRSLEWQQYRYSLYKTKGGPVAAYPGTSNHGLGMAIDIGNYYKHPQKTLQAVGLKYGFRFDTPTEAWHCVFTGAPSFASVSTSTPLQIAQEMPMQHIKITDGGGFRHAIQFGSLFQASQLNDSIQGEKWTQLYGTPRSVDGAGWAEAQNIAGVFAQAEEARIRKVLSTLVPASAGVQVNAASPADVTAAADRVIASIPTRFGAIT